METYEQLFRVRAIFNFGIGGIGNYESEVDFQTAQLMMQAKVVTIGGKTINVKSVEVTDNGLVNFYGDEIKRARNAEEPSIQDVEEWVK